MCVLGPDSVWRVNMCDTLGMSGGGSGKQQMVLCFKAEPSELIWRSRGRSDVPGCNGLC